MATVVAKLWNIVRPAAPVLRSYFGQKDAQQLTVLRRLATDLDIDVDVRAVPIVRSPEGLALSSRNTRLDAAGLEHALVLSRALRSWPTPRRPVNPSTSRPRAGWSRTSRASSWTTSWWWTGTPSPSSVRSCCASRCAARPSPSWPRTCRPSG